MMGDIQIKSFIIIIITTITITIINMVHNPAPAKCGK